MSTLLTYEIGIFNPNLFSFFKTPSAPGRRQARRTRFLRPAAISPIFDLNFCAEFPIDFFPIPRYNSIVN